jgi:hypothetical protein
VRINDRGHNGLAGQVHGRGVGRGLNVTVLADGDEPVSLYDEGCILDGRAAITQDQARATKDSLSLRLGGAGREQHKAESEERTPIHYSSPVSDALRGNVPTLHGKNQDCQRKLRFDLSKRGTAISAAMDTAIIP